jgi:hypothetical protein
MTEGKTQLREGGSWRFLPPPNTAKRIMLPNEVFALECRAYYESIGLVVDATNGEFAHCPYPEGMGETGYYLLWEHHQQQGILQSRDVGQCCFFVGHANKWLLECDPIPEDYFSLWDMFEEYSSVLGSEAGKKAHEEKDENGKSFHSLKLNKKLHKEKDETGRSIHAVGMGKIGGKKSHEEKDEFGRSLHNMKLHQEKDELGKSVVAVRLHKEKDEKGRSLHAMGTLHQVWKSTIDGFQSTSSAVAAHNRRKGWDPAARVKVGV